MTIENWGLASILLACSTPALLISSTSWVRYHDGGGSAPVFSSPVTSPTPSTLISPFWTTKARSPTVSSTLAEASPRSFLPGSGGIRLDLNLASTSINTRARDTQVPPGMDRHMGRLLAARTRGEPPDPSREPRRVINRRTGPPAHFPVRQATAGRANPRRAEPSGSTSYGQVRLGIFHGVVVSFRLPVTLISHLHNLKPSFSRLAQFLATGNWQFGFDFLATGAHLDAQDPSATS